MPPRFALLIVVTILALHPKVTLAEEVKDFWVTQQLGDNNTLWAISRSGADTSSANWQQTLSNQLQPLVEKLTATVTNGEALVKAISDTDKEAATSFVYVPAADWTKTLKSPPKDKFLVSIQARSTTTSSPLSFGYILFFQTPIDEEVARSIAKNFNLAVGPEVKKISQQFFTEKFEAAMPEAQKAKAAAAEKVDQLDAERRRLQLRSQEELPYEKVADHLADLQRQQLTLRLSIVGMDAKREEIEKQLIVAERRLKDKANEAAKAVSSDEMVDTLKQLVKLRTEHADLIKTRNRAGVAGGSDAEVSEAIAKVLEAKVQLLTLQGKKLPQTSHEQLDALQAELTRLAIDRSEQHARLEYLEKMRHEVQERIASRADLDQAIKRIDEKLPSAKTALRTAENRVKELEDAKAAFKPIDLTKNDN